MQEVSAKILFSSNKFSEIVEIENLAKRIMKKLIYVFLIILFVQTLGFGQSLQSCVQITAESNSIKATDSDIFKPSEPIIVKAVLNDTVQTTNLKFNWKNSIDSQTTDKEVFVINPNHGFEGVEVKVNVDIQGLPENCLKNYETTILIGPRLIVCVFDYNPSNEYEEYSQLLQLTFSILDDKEKDLKAILLIQTKDTESLKLHQRLQKIVRYLDWRKFPFDKFVIVIEKGNDELTTPYIVEAKTEYNSKNKYKIISQDEMAKLLKESQRPKKITRKKLNK